jgi:hypothetical protein
MLPVQWHGSGEDVLSLAEPRAVRILHPGLSFRQSWGYLSTSRREEKTYGRFFCTIFFGRAGSALVAHRQRLATAKPLKNSENAKTSVIFFRGDARFSAKQPPRSARFSCQYLS